MCLGDGISLGLEKGELNREQMTKRVEDRR